MPPEKKTPKKKTTIDEKLEAIREQLEEREKFADITAPNLTGRPELRIGAEEIQKHGRRGQAP